MKTYEKPTLERRADLSTGPHWLTRLAQALVLPEDGRKS